jgi:MFS family permease
MLTVLLAIWAIGFAAFLAASMSVLADNVRKGDRTSYVLLLGFVFVILSIIWPLSIWAISRDGVKEE